MKKVIDFDFCLKYKEFKHAYHGPLFFFCVALVVKEKNEFVMVATAFSFLFFRKDI